MCCSKRSQILNPELVIRIAIARQKNVKDELVVPASDTSADNGEHNSEFPLLREPALLKAAQEIYRSYYENNPRMVQRPIGVVINRITYRGKPTFSDKPILLFGETFIPKSEIESEIY